MTRLTPKVGMRVRRGSEVGKVTKVSSAGGLVTVVVGRGVYGSMKVWRVEGLVKA